MRAAEPAEPAATEPFAAAADPSAPPSAGRQAAGGAGASDPFAGWPDDAPPRSASPWAGATRAAGTPTPPAYPTVPAAEPARAPDGGARPTWPVLVVVAVLLVAGLIWAITMLGGRGGSGTAAASTSPGTAAALSASTSSMASPSSANVESTQAQAARTAVASVLDAGRGSRTTLVQGISAYCTKGDKTGGAAQIGDALQGRMAQLAKLNDVGDAPFRGLAGGLDARDKLKAALQAAASADQVYVQLAAAGTVCQESAQLTAANAQASNAKKAFLDTWNPLMSKAKLQGLASDDI